MLEALNHIKSLLRGVWNFRWTGLITAAIVGLLTGLLAIFWPNKYEATARVYVDTQSILKEVLRGVAVQPNGAEQVSMVSRTLISRPNVERVMLAAQLNLEAVDTKARDRLVDDLMKDIEFKAVGNISSNLFTISYKNKKAETAKTVVQTLVSIFVEKSLGTIRTDADQSVRFLNEQIKEYEQRLLLSENSLKEFKIKNMGLMPGSGGGDYVSRIQDMDAQVRQARLEVRQAENARDSIKRQLTGESPTMGSADETTTTSAGPRRRSETDEALDSAIKRLDELRSRFTIEHPDVIAAQRQVDQAKIARDKEASGVPSGSGATTTTTRNAVSNPVYKELRVQLADAEATVASQRVKQQEYESRLSQTRDLASSVPKVEADFTQLTRDYETNRIKHQKLIESRESVEISNKMSGSAGVAEIRIVDPPRVSPLPVSPNRFMLLVGSLFLTIAAGFAAALFRDQSNPTFFDVRTLRTFTGMPLLGGVSFVTSAIGRAKARTELLAFGASTAGLLLCFALAIAYFGLKQFTS